MKMHVLIVILLPFLVIRAHGEQQQSMKGTVPALIGDSLSPTADISNLIRSAGVSKPFVQIMVNAVSRDSLVETIGALQSFGTRYEFTPQRDEAAEFILDKFKSWGLQAESDRFVVGRGLFYSFNDMDISGADTAWLAMYYSILRTTDGGNTWTSSSGPLGYMNAIGIDFINSREGWVVGEPRAILHTTDGGSTWELQNQFLSEGLQHVGFSDLSNGIAVGTGGRVIRTTDGGVSWITANSGTVQDLLRVKVLDNTHAWSVGGGGTILFSGNGGSTWTVQATGITTKISGIDFVDERHGWAAPAKGAMLKTTDGGTTWAKKGLDTQCWKSISFVDTLLGYATDCSGNILKTTDGGESWNLSLPSLQAGWHPMLNAVRAFGKQRIFACGERSTIFTSTNQGTTWTNQIANLPEEFIHRTRNIVATIPGSITPEKECVIVAHYDSYSYDMFMPYDIVPGANDNASGTSSVLEAARICRGYRFENTIRFLAVSAEELGMFGSAHYVSSAKEAHRTIIGAVNGDMIGYPARNDTLALVASSYLSRNRLVDSALVYNQRYGIGLNLSAVIDSTGASDYGPFAIAGYDALNIAEATAREIWNGADPYYHSMSDLLEHIHPGMLHRGAQLMLAAIAELAQPYDRITAVSQADELPERLWLSQNYPNPFNPLTNLEFSLAYRSYVKLSIYDLLGREVAVLVNEEKPAGTYRATWDAAMMPSGVYFYRLNTGEFVETKKMVLLR